MKKFLIFLIFIFLNAKIVDRVIVSVNGEPITSYELNKTVALLKISPKEALNILIDKKIIDEEIKKRGIEVDEFDIENALEKIASKNGMSVFEFKNFLKAKGEYNKFIKNLKDNLLKQKLFSQIVSSRLKITPKELKNYYNQHKDEFKTFKNIEVVKYQSNNPENLKKVIKNHMFLLDNVKVEIQDFNVSNLPLNLIYLFNSVKKDSFTPIFSNDEGYVTYYINKKEGVTTIPFEKVKDIIYQKLANKKREEILKDYFNTLKNQADIEYFN